MLNKSSPRSSALLAALTLSLVTGLAGCNRQNPDASTPPPAQTDGTGGAAAGTGTTVPSTQTSPSADTGPATGSPAVGGMNGTGGSNSDGQVTTPPSDAASSNRTMP